jgi:eukaryotic-like serine/threonine-protein kinase
MQDPNAALLDPAQLKIGATFGARYQVVACLNTGGMGAVYEVVHLETRRRRALKVMLPSVAADEDARGRFKREATVAAEIESEHIVEIFDAGVDGETGAPFIVMELLKGEELADLLARRVKLPPELVVTYLAQVGVALDKTHAAGVVHRDLKPENLFLTQRDDGSPRVKILDFGIAKVVAQSAAVTRTVGTPLYMAPEQIKGEPIGPAVDRYALTQIAYTLLTGQAYWETENTASQGVYTFLMRVAEGVKQPPTERARARDVVLPPAFDVWFFKGAAVNPADRFASGSALVAALADVFGIAAPLSGDDLVELPSSDWRGSSTDLDFRSITGSGPTEPVAPAASIAPRGSASQTISATELAPVLPRRNNRRTLAMLGAVVALAVSIGVTVVVSGTDTSPSAAPTEPATTGREDVPPPAEDEGAAVEPVIGPAEPVAQADAAPPPPAAASTPVASRLPAGRPAAARPRPDEKPAPREEPKKPATATGSGRDPLDVR